MCTRSSTFEKSNCSRDARCRFVWMQAELARGITQMPTLDSVCPVRRRVSASGGNIHESRGRSSRHQCSTHLVGLHTDCTRCCSKLRSVRREAEYVAAPTRARRRGERAQPWCSSAWRACASARCPIAVDPGQRTLPSGRARAPREPCPHTRHPSGARKVSF